MDQITEEPLILKPGSRYVLRNGLVTESLTRPPHVTSYIYVANVKEPQHDTPTVACWLSSGRFLTNTIDHRLDIVSEYKQGGTNGPDH